MPARKLTPTRIKKVAENIGLGMSQKNAFIMADVLEGTASQWMNRGRKDIADGNDKTHEAKLVIAVESARGKLEHKVIQKIRIIDVDVDAFTFLKYMHEREDKQAAQRAQAGNGLEHYTPPNVEDAP